MYFLRFAKKDQEYIHNLNQWILERYREDFSSIEYYSNFAFGKMEWD